MGGYGENEGPRTPDLNIKSVLLYQLSYILMDGAKRIELLPQGPKPCVLPLYDAPMKSKGWFNFYTATHQQSSVSSLYTLDMYTHEPP